MQFHLILERFAQQTQEQIKMPPSKSFPDNLSVEERTEQARTEVSKLVDLIRDIVGSIENNKIVLYSNQLSEQIPRSRAANAFNHLQRCMHYFVLVRLMSIWDHQSKDKTSFHTVRVLVQSPEVREKVLEEIYVYHADQTQPRDLTPSDNPEIVDLKRQFWERERVRRAVKENRRAKRMLAVALGRIEQIEKDYIKDGLRPFRHSYIAHNLDIETQTRHAPIRLSYGDENKVLTASVKIIHYLHMALNGSHFSWDEALQHARENAEMLWSTCKFEIGE